MATKQTGFRIEKAILADLKNLAKQEDRSMNWLVNESVKKYTKDNLKTKK